jgi:predicted transcriptional regulator
LVGTERIKLSFSESKKDMSALDILLLWNSESFETPLNMLILVVGYRKIVYKSEIEMCALIMSTLPKRRDKLDIIAQITEIAQNGALKTQIMYRANLSFSQLGEYLAMLGKINLLEKSSEQGREVYRATAKGIDFLERHRDMTLLLNDDNNGKACLRIPNQKQINRQKIYPTTA